MELIFYYCFTKFSSEGLRICFFGLLRIHQSDHLFPLDNWISLRLDMSVRTNTCSRADQFCPCSRKTQIARAHKNWKFLVNIYMFINFIYVHEQQRLAHTFVHEHARHIFNIFFFAHAQGNAQNVFENISWKKIMHNACSST